MTSTNGIVGSIYRGWTINVDQCHSTSPTQELGPPIAADLFMWEEALSGLQILQRDGGLLEFAGTNSF